MAAVRWTTEAELWLKDIHDYIAQDDPEAAARIVNGIYEKGLLLKSFPEIGYKHTSEPGRNIRVLLYGHYRLAYLIKPDGDIDVLGVFHGAMDINRYLL